MGVVMSMRVVVELALGGTDLSTELAALLVVSDVLVSDQLTGSMGVQIVGHIVALLLHVVTKLVEGRGADQVALAIDLPGDRSVLGADFVVAACSGGGSSIVVDILSVLPINNPSSNQIGVEVRFVIDDGEDLALDTNGGSNVLGFKSLEGTLRKLAEDTVVERSLVLVNFPAGTRGRMRPVDLVGFSDDHSLAVLPVVFCGELGVLLVVVVATESSTDLLLGERAPVIFGIRGSGVSLRAVPELVVLSDRVVLCAQMPVDVDGAHGALPVVLGVGYNIDFQATFVSLGDVRASLRTRNMHAVHVGEIEFRAGAGILLLLEDGLNFRRDVVRDVRPELSFLLQFVDAFLDIVQTAHDVLEQVAHVLICAHATQASLQARNKSTNARAYYTH